MRLSRLLLLLPLIVIGATASYLVARIEQGVEVTQTVVALSGLVGSLAGAAFAAAIFVVEIGRDERAEPVFAVDCAIFRCPKGTKYGALWLGVVNTGGTGAAVRYVEVVLHDGSTRRVPLPIKLDAHPIVPAGGYIELDVPIDAALHATVQQAARIRVIPAVGRAGETNLTSDERPFTLAGVHGARPSV